MANLKLVAGSLQVSDRTLRRAASRGTIRSEHKGARRLELPIQEVLYLERAWPLLQALIGSLRTLPNVRMAVLFGSLARGDGRAESDADLLVRFAEPGLGARGQLIKHLEATAGRRIQLVEQGEASPLLLADVVRDGRVLVDRDGDWAALVATAPQLARAAAAERDALERELFAGLDELLAKAAVE
ncbi:MAG TPA: nucleotidyltransferase domain-containing protein [Gaiellaceae bacterium]